MIDIALLDGGLGQEINKRSPGDSHPLWSVKVMFDTPATVVDVHTAFIEAGAKVICLNTYAATPSRLERNGYSERFVDAQTTAIRLAREAVANAKQAPGDIQIAGCLPPLVASYKPEVSQGYQDSLEEYRRIVVLQKESVDLFLVETMANIVEATAAVDAAQETGKPVYVGLTLADDLSNTLRSGEPLEEAITALAQKKPDGILINCSFPEAISKAMPLLAQSGIRCGGYANGFTSIDKLKPGGTVDVLEARLDLTPEAYANYVEQWIADGATIVGGCCEVGPDHIAYLANRLGTLGHTVSNLS